MFKKEGDFERLCLKLNYQFRSKELLAKAITTKSAWYNNLQKAVIGHHEEMAFFGDGILRMVVDKILMEEFPYYNAGELSKVRDILVKNANLSEAAKRLEFEQFILMDSNQVKQCQQGNPKLLADTIEAIIYAIYKDSGENLQEVKNFILSHSSISNILKEHREQEERRNMPIILAIRTGNVDNVQKLLESGFSPNFLFSHLESDIAQTMYCYEEIINEKFLTPLDYALYCLEKIASVEESSKDMLSIIECLLKFGANPDLHAKDRASLIRQLFSPRTYDGKITDSFFARFNREEAIKQGSKIISTEIEKILEKELIPSWEKITDQVVKMLCRFGAKLDEENFSQYETSLELAIIHQQKYKIDLLLQYKNNPNIQNRLGETPLHLATLFADEALVIKLLNAGADASIANRKGFTPFDIAPLPKLKILLLKTEIKQAIQIAIENINVEEIKSNAMSHYNKWLAYKLPEELAQAIRLFTQVLKYKLYKRNFQDKSLVADFYNLGSAYFQRQGYEKAKPLLERAYFLYQINEQLFQPKTNKYFNRLTDCKKLIEENTSQEPSNLATQANNNLSKNLASSAQIKSNTIVSNDQQSNDNKFDHELFSATKIYHSDKVKDLLNKGANPDAVSAFHGPILHYAIEIYNQAILMSEATSDIPYNEFSIGSFKRGTLKIIELLLAFGADPNQQDAKGRTALHIAAIFNKTNVIRLLLEKGGNPNARDHSNNFASHYAKESYARQLILTALLPPAKSIKMTVTPSYNEQVLKLEKEFSQIKKLLDQEDDFIKNDTQKAKHLKSESNQSLLSNTNINSHVEPVKHLSVMSSSANNAKEKLQKTKRCRFFKEEKPNSCKKGDQCKFAHGKAELKK